MDEPADSFLLTTLLPGMTSVDVEDESPGNLDDPRRVEAYQWVGQREFPVDSGILIDGPVLSHFLVGLNLRGVIDSLTIRLLTMTIPKIESAYS